MTLMISRINSARKSTIVLLDMTTYAMDQTDHSIHSIHPPPPLASGGYDLEMGTNTTKILKYMENSDQKMID
jgi:hypothetical protein